MYLSKLIYLIQLLTTDFQKFVFRFPLSQIAKHIRDRNRLSHSLIKIFGAFYFLAYEMAESYRRILDISSDCELNLGMMLRTVRARSLMLQVSRLHTSAYRLNKKKWTEQEFDDAEIFSHKLTSQPYYAKREREEGYQQQYEQDPDQPQLTQAEILKQNQKVETIKGIVQGLLVLGALFGGFQAYQKWPNIKSWIFNYGEEYVPPKKKKQIMELPVIKDKNDSSVPGLYIWGDNSNGITGQNQKQQPDTKWPLRHPWFDGKYLKGVASGEKSAVAIDEKGDLIQWGNGYKKGKNVEPEYTVKGEGLQYAHISNGVIYALNKKNEILVIPESSETQKNFKGLKKRNWYLISSTKKYSKIPTDSLLNKGEKVIDFKTGKVHLIALTNQGRAFAAATGLEQSKAKSQGQFGIPEFSHFAKPPPPNELYEIKLLNNSIEKTPKGKIDHIEPRFIQKIAVGNYHTLALDSNGELYTFGQNTFGQLGQQVTYGSEFITLPTKVDTLIKHTKRDHFPEVVDIHAGGDTSFCIVNPIKMFKLVRDFKSNKLKDTDEHSPDDAFTVGFGNNLKGQIGTGHYVHAQADPAKIKELQHFEDFNEETQLMEKIKLVSWSTGQDHTFIKLANNDVLYWGGNDNGQLGNGKKNRIPKPSSPPALIEPDFTTQTYKELTFVNRLQLRDNQQIVAGENASAIYYTK